MLEIKKAVTQTYSYLYRTIILQNCQFSKKIIHQTGFEYKRFVSEFLK